MPTRTIAAAFVLMFAGSTVWADQQYAAARGLLCVGIAETDITLPVGFPMAGYYHKRLAEGTLDSLKARAIVFRDGDTAAALVVCDLIGIATDLSREVHKRASEKTGMPEGNIFISATHPHTAPANSLRKPGCRISIESVGTRTD